MDYEILSFKFVFIYLGIDMGLGLIYKINDGIVWNR
jgi:hypothetical protein